MRLKTKILLAQAPLVAALCAVALVCAMTAARLGQKPGVILAENFRSIRAMESLRELLERDTPETSELERWVKIQEGNITEPGEEKATQALRAALTAWTASPESSGARGELYSAIRRILELNHDAMSIKSNLARRAADDAVSLMLLVTCGACILGLIVTTTLTERILRPLSVLTQAVRRIGGGDFGAHVRLSGNDETAELADEVNKMATHLGQYKNSSLGELLEAQQAAQAAINSLRDPVVVYQIDGNLLIANEAARELKGLGLQILEPTEERLLDPALASAIEQIRGYVLAGNGPFFPQDLEAAVPIPSPEGERWLLPHAAPLYGPKGAIKGVTVVLQDVTRMHRFAQFKTDLVATAAHEFRTPLTSLHMAIHLCLEGVVGPLTEKQLDLLSAARSDCERLQSLIDELLHLAKLESGAVPFHPKKARAAELLDKALEEHSTAARDQRIRLGARGAGTGAELDVLADRERVQRVFDNLLSNALQHTPPGGRIELGCEAEGAFARFEVSDSGAGIPAEYQARVFERFFRIPGTERRGSGLGLTIAQQIVHEHGGEIGVRSAPGEGSTFWFTLPLAPAEAAASP